jgi:hypothetical protein
MEAIHRFEGWVSPSGIEAWELSIALRGKHVDGVWPPQRIHVSEYARDELPFVLVCFSAELVGPYLRCGSNIARANVDVAGVNEF